MFGLGYFKYIPGTVASLVTCLIFYFFWLNFNIKNYNILIYIFLFTLFLISIFFIDKIYIHEDSKEIVVDEFVGQSIPLLAWSNLHLTSSLSYILSNTIFAGREIELWIILSFILFRFFDIFKPFPINLIDNKIKNGFGVMFDDIIAGLFTLLTLCIFFLWI